jgi:hypothetical protein
MLTRDCVLRDAPSGLLRMTKVEVCGRAWTEERSNVRHAEEGASAMRLSRSTHWRPAFSALPGRVPRIHGAPCKPSHRRQASRHGPPEQVRGRQTGRNELDSTCVEADR